MADNDDLAAAIIALGAIGLGVAGFAALSARDQKKRFKQALEAGLSDYGVGLVSAELGRAASGGPSWIVTLNHPWQGLLSYHVDFRRGRNAYHANTLSEVIDRLLKTMPPTERNWGYG